MLNFLKLNNLFFSSDDKVGIDIDDKSIKVVQIKKKNKKYILNKAGVLPLLESCVADGKIVNEKRLKEYIIKAFKKFQIDSKKVVYTIPEQNVFHISFLSPHSDRRKINEMVKWEISTVKNRPVEDFYYTWRIVEYIDEEDSYLVDVSFVKKSVVKQMDRIFKDLKLELLGCEFEVNTYSNFFKERFLSKPLLVVDISDKNSNFIIYEKGGIKMTSMSSFSSGLMTDILSKTLNISLEEAERMKKRENIGAVFDNKYFFKALQPVVDGLITEVKNFEDFYYDNFSKKKIDDILIVGGGAKMKGLSKYLTYKFNKREIQLPKANHIFYHRDLNFQSNDLLQYLVAIGTVLG